MPETCRWHRLATVTVPAPVLAVLPDADGCWLGGPGGAVHTTTGERSPSRPVAAFCVVGDALLAGGPSGILRRADAGWRQADMRAAGAPVAAMLVLGTDTGTPAGAGGGRSAASGVAGLDEPDVVLAATLGDGVLRSGDGGITWASANFGLEHPEVTCLATTADGTVLAGTAGGIYRARAGGRAWTGCAGTEQWEAAGLAALPTGAVVAALEDGGVARSADNGLNWSSIGRAPTEAGGILAITATPSGALVLGTTTGALRSVDGGASWTTTTTSTASGIATTTAGGVHALATDGGRVLAGTSDGLLTSTDDGAGWCSVEAPPVHDLDRLLVRDGRPVVAGARSGLAEQDAAGSWSRCTEVPFPLTGVAVTPAGSLLASGPDGLFRQPPRETGWEQVQPAETGEVARLAFGPDGFGWAAPARHGEFILHSQDDGRTWSRFDAPFGATAPAALLWRENGLLAVTVDRRRGAIQLWSSGDDGRTWRCDVRAGTGWPQVTTLPGPGWLGLGRSLFGRDGDGSWQRVHDFDGGIRAAASSSSGMAVLTEHSLWIRAGGEEWERVKAAVDLEQVTDLAVTGDRLLVLATGGRLWCRDLPAPTGSRKKH